MKKICIIWAGKFGLALYKTLDKNNEIVFASRTKKHKLNYIDFGRAFQSFSETYDEEVSAGLENIIKILTSICN